MELLLCDPHNSQTFTAMCIGPLNLCTDSSCTSAKQWHCYYTDSGHIAIASAAKEFHVTNDPITVRPGIFQWNLLCATGINLPMLVKSWAKCSNCGRLLNCDAHEILQKLTVAFAGISAGLAEISEQIDTRDDAVLAAEADTASAQYAAQYWYQHACETVHTLTQAQHELRQASTPRRPKSTYGRRQNSADPLTAETDSN